MSAIFHKKLVGTLMFTLLILVSIEAEAAKWILINGKLYYASLLCEGAYKGTGNTDTNPAIAVCSVTATQAEVLCSNPQDQTVLPGKAGIQLFFNESDQIDASEVDGKGKAYPQVHIDTDEQLLDPNNCVNPNWIPTAGLIYKATMDLKIYACVDAGCTQYGNLLNSTAWSCELPPEYDFFNMPVSGETEYNCTKASQ